MASKHTLLGRLPVKVRLNGHELLINKFQPQQIVEAYRLVCAEASLGQDVGQDEFPSEDHLMLHLQNSHSFSFTDPHQGALQAFLTLAPSAYSRMATPLLADGIIICDTLIKPHIIQPLIQVALTLATDTGYQCVLADVFNTSDLVGALRDEGFVVIGCIPNSGHLTGRGWTDCLVMFKDITASANQPYMRHLPTTGQLGPQPLSSKEDRLTQDMAEEVESSFRASSVPSCPEPSQPQSLFTDGFSFQKYAGLEKSLVKSSLHKPFSTCVRSCSTTGEKKKTSEVMDHIPAMATLRYRNQKRPVSYFPRDYTFRSGDKITLRYLQESDIPAVYDMYREAAAQGDGFSTDEFLTIDIFRYYVIDYGQPIVGQDSSSKIVIAASVVPCILCRTVDPLTADTYLVVDQKFKGKGIGMEASSIILKFTQELGYTGVLADCLTDNLPIIKIMKKTGFSITGYIPKTSKRKDKKIGDALLFYKDLRTLDSKL